MASRVVLKDVLRVLGIAAHLHAEPVHLRLMAFEEASSACRSPVRAADEQAFVRRLGFGHDPMLPDEDEGRVTPTAPRAQEQEPASTETSTAGGCRSVP